MKTFTVEVTQVVTATTAAEREELIALLDECGAKWQAMADAVGTKGERRAKSEHKRVCGRLEVFAVGYLRKLIGDVEALLAAGPSDDLTAASQLEHSGLISREKFNHIVENIRARDAVRSAMA